jgi:hypothetical protein
MRRDVAGNPGMILSPPTSGDTTTRKPSLTLGRPMPPVCPSMQSSHGMRGKHMQLQLQTFSNTDQPTLPSPDMLPHACSKAGPCCHGLEGGMAKQMTSSSPRIDQEIRDFSPNFFVPTQSHTIPLKPGVRARRGPGSRRFLKVWLATHNSTSEKFELLPQQRSLLRRAC